LPPLLSAQDLTITFPVEGRPVEVVRGASFSVDRGEFVGLVGESGCGKSVSALAVLRLVPPPGRIAGGRVFFEGSDLLELPSEEMRRVRGGKIGIVFQEPMTSLNPVFTIGFQIGESLRIHQGLSRKAAREAAVELLDRVAVPAPGQRVDDYPHQLSGGQRQRAMIAMALACGPDLLIADEPTTALDVTVQAQILELLDRLRAELDLAVLLITHDLAVVAETCDRALVMYSGRIVEEARVAELFAGPRHPYTRGLLKAVPRLGRPAPRGGLPTIAGQVPDAARMPAGCAFHPRCSEVMEVCSQRAPDRYRVGEAQWSRCFLDEPSEAAAE
jgi:oligopeptide/dipeptide ABC transporter ATP-binding protein